jgi:hypothetical protein
LSAWYWSFIYYSAFSWASAAATTFFDLTDNLIEDLAVAAAGVSIAAELAASA